MGRPKKLDNLLEVVSEHVESGDYLLTTHAQQRGAQRAITRPEVEFVLTHGWHEKRKDRFDETYQAWNYAVRGKTVADERELRIIVTFDDDMLVVTVIDLN
ncbi:DUF4258 domain-containing protein [Persicimonas caeni]|uniref:DUF4258 domain-containing protein n=1 Tax=Persicimonas caeni TaxID=2292766 RepID=A0A4Y6Q2C7_PERCE|nr:DUF4258 domain-containing protein [Persicimonas caeni]QDG54748.1 DUF4258 domain-containing protein [Persicimonas caeni]QED35969.1 DUF4258 domain-containing protein [Persicimonas caeni]